MTGRFTAPRAAVCAVLLLAAYSVIEGWLFDFHEAGAQLTWPKRSTLASLPTWFGWLVLILPGLRYFRSNPFDPARAKLVIGRYVAAGVGFALLHGLIAVPLSLWIVSVPPPAHHVQLLRVAWWSLLRAPSALLQWMAFAAVYHAILFARASAEQEARASRIGAALAEAELNALKTQLEPHFLFNTLNSIKAFAESNPPLATRLVTLLSRMLRGVLELRRQQEVTVGRELALVRDYLEIQRLRFGQRLGVHVEADDDVSEAAIPVMMIQPMVENAVEHSVGRDSAPARLVIRANRVANDLMIEVRD